ncbi:MAG: YqgE/AlgH family protein [Flavobacteriales bacterium]|nr:YqgE/AlgH family protein [Flavobacteriales bacterium]
MSNNFLDLRPENKLEPARGRLLVSEPFLPDPYFRRTVVLLCEHNDEGSFGFVLNRHMDMDIDQLMDRMPPIGSKVSIGGPVQSSNLYYLHTLGPHLDGALKLLMVSTWVEISSVEIHPQHRSKTGKARAFFRRVFRMDRRSA